MTKPQDRASSDELTLALLQHSPTPAAIESSIARLSSACQQAAEQQADLLLVPEASLTGYNISPESAQAVAVEREGKVTDRLRSLCQQSGIALAYGYIERDGDTLYNTAQIIDSSGEIIAHYRKTHLWGDLDRSLFEAGQSYSPLTPFKGWNLGLLICYDIEFPESARHLALQGCELILAPTALMTPWTFVARHVTRVRAAENQLYFAYANYCDAENTIDYVGHSCIVGPDGEDLARAESTPALLVSTLSKQAIAQAREALPYHSDRRPELYSIR